MTLPSPVVGGSEAAAAPFMAEGAARVAAGRAMNAEGGDRGRRA